MIAKAKPVITADNYSRLLPRPGRDRDRFKDSGRGAVPGLTLAVTAAGSRRWVYIYRERGTRRKVFLHLGDVEDLGLAQARVKARAQRALRDDGQDPREERRRQETERRQRARDADRLESETLAAAVDAYLEAKQEEWSPTTLRERERITRAYLPEMRSCNRPVAEVRPFEVEEDLKRLAPIMANRVRSLLLAASRWAVRKERLSRDVVSATDRPTKQETKRSRVLTDDELRDLWRGRPEDAPEDSPEDSPTIPATIHAYAKLLLLCGTRRGETAAADWSDIDLDDDKVWHIPGEARKNGKPLDVPLSGAAVELLRALEPREQGRVFPAMIAACPGRIMANIRAALAIKKDSPGDWKMHDLRRSFATGLQRLGVALPVITAALGQTPPREMGTADATATYTRHDYFDERRTALESWARHVEALATGAKLAPVVPIARGRRR
jgi:integrase